MRMLRALRYAPTWLADEADNAIAQARLAQTRSHGAMTPRRSAR
jgi:hypothetical protein